MTSAAGVSYTYDGDGRRVKKSNGKLYWYGSGGDPLEETDLSGTPTADFIFLGGKRTARLDLPGGAVHYYFANHLGSASVVTSSTGAIQDESDFYPFGGERAVTDTDPNPYKFTGKERDAESGLDYFGARYYSSSLGRFATPDWTSSASAVPYANFVDSQTLNLYGFTRNSPLTYIDRKGHCTEPLSFMVCLAIAAAATALAIHELHQWQEARQKAENEAFEKSYGCAMGSAQCTEGEIRAYDKERLNTYGEGAIKAIENTVPDATPATTVTGVLVDQAKSKVVDAMVDSAKKDGQQAPQQSTQQQQQQQQQQPQQQQQEQQQKTGFWRSVKNFFSPAPPPPPPPPPPTPPPCSSNRQHPC